MTNTPTPDYNVTITPTMKIMLKEAAEQGARAAISKIMQGGMNLDNFTADGTVMPESENGMGKRQRFHVPLPSGEMVWLTGNTIGEAFANGLKKYGASQPQSNAAMFGEYAKRWFDLYKRPKHKPTTLKTYESLFTKHILPFFENKRLNEITTDDVQAFINKRAAMAHSSVRQMKVLLHEIFKAAMEDDLMNKDPTASGRLTLPTKVTPRNALDTAEFVDVMRNINKLEAEDAKLVALMLFTGMRRGEVLGLRWEDIDTEAGLIHVRGGVTYTSNQPIAGTPKSNAGKRPLPIAAELKPYLTGGQGYVLGGDKPWTQSKYDRAWERISKKINMHGATAHILRHSYLTLLGGTGATAKTIQAIAGHADITTTMNRYVHKREEDILSAGMAFDKLTQRLTQANTEKPL